MESLLTALARRGPDGSGVLTGPWGALGHTRLAIVDVTGGAQPLLSEDGAVAAVVNGEIYNYRGLRAELTAAGHHFASGSDSEVVVHGYEAWGEGVVRRLHGMFALLVWD
ncbi:MAG: asparagine synthetase B, partial [Clostridia bacterium]|nr:asparagine synthetase B [Clostridia bacterium]